MQKRVRDIFGPIDTVLGAITNFTLFVMMLSITLDAAGRYLFNRPLTGNMEATSFYFLVILAFLGLPLAHKGNEHIRIEVFRKLMLRVPGRLVDRLHSLLSALAFGFFAWHSGRLAVEKFMDLETSLGAIQFPLYLSYVWVPIGTGYLTLRLVVEMFYPANAPEGSA